ncbi:MAG: BolA/IbaG family iron-sulfur metabolism protein [Pseudomonadota bacterium]
MQQEISERLLAEFPDAEIAVELDGNRALLSVTSSRFEDMSRVQKQQAVYACVADYIASGDLHAVTIKAQTPA